MSSSTLRPVLPSSNGDSYVIIYDNSADSYSCFKLSSNGYSSTSIYGDFTVSDGVASCSYFSQGPSWKYFYLDKVSNSWVAPNSYPTSFPVSRYSIVASSIDLVYMPTYSSSYPFVSRTSFDPNSVIVRSGELLGEAWYPTLGSVIIPSDLITTLQGCSILASILLPVVVGFLAFRKAYGFIKLTLGGA